MQKPSTGQLSNIERINYLDQEGHLMPLVKAGYFPVKILVHRDVFQYVNAQKLSGVKTEAAVRSAEVCFRLCRSTIYEILRSFK